MGSVEPFLIDHVGPWAFTVVSACGAAWALFQLLGTKWLEARFQKDLEDFKAKKNAELESIKSAQAIELEHLRGRIQRLFDRTAKLHQNEFEVLPKIWDLMTKALSETIAFTARIQSITAISRMGSGQLNEFFKTLELPAWQEEELRGLQGKAMDDKLHEMVFWVRLQRAERYHSDFHNYLISHGIFIEEELREKIRDLSNLNYDAIKERAIDQEHGGLLGADRFPKGDLMQSKGIDQMNAVRALVQSRLWDAEKL
jgi:hypothetical protein